MFCFDAAIHEAVMALPPDERRDRAKNESWSMAGGKGCVGIVSTSLPLLAAYAWMVARRRGNDDAGKSSSKNISRNIFSDFCRSRARSRSQPSRVEQLVR